MMNIWVQILLVVFSCGLTLLGTIFVMILKGIKEDLKKMTHSVNRLNQQIGVVINDQEWHKSEIDEMKKRLDDLEQPKTKE